MRCLPTVIRRYIRSEENKCWRVASDSRKDLQWTTKASKMTNPELPTIQYRSHRLGYSVAAVLGFLAAWQGYYWLASGSVTSFFSWIFLIVGVIAFLGCTWTAILNSLVLELNKEGVMYKKVTYSWNSLSSYAIRKEIGESGVFVYLLLSFKDDREPLEIQLDWLDNSESVPEQMEVYAKNFQIKFDGVEKKEF